MAIATYTAVHTGGVVAAIPPNDVRDYAHLLKNKRVALVKIEGSYTYKGYYDIDTESVLWEPVVSYEDRQRSKPTQEELDTTLATLEWAAGNTDITALSATDSIAAFKAAAGYLPHAIGEMG